MAHGGPDWGTEGPVSTIYSIQDLGELAARLGSPVTFDRRGNVIWYDDFESGVEGWWYSGSPAGWTVLWSPDQHRSGGFSIELTPKNQADAYAYTYRDFPYPSPTRLGVEINFNFSGWIKELDFNVRIYDGIFRYEAYMRFLPDSGTWQYQGSDGVYHDLTPTTGLIVGIMFHTFKLVVDLTTGKFVRLIVDATTFDLSSYAMHQASAPAESPSIQVYFKVIDETTYLSQSWLDDIILTQNEP